MSARIDEIAFLSRAELMQLVLSKEFGMSQAQAQVAVAQRLQPADTAQDKKRKEPTSITPTATTVNTTDATTSQTSSATTTISADSDNTNPKKQKTKAVADKFKREKRQKKRTEKRKKFDFDKCNYRHVFLKFMYIGQNYQGKSFLYGVLGVLYQEDALFSDVFVLVFCFVNLLFLHRFPPSIYDQTKGFATQDNTTNTVEAEVIQALEKCCLIKDKESSSWSRCGRTDKGELERRQERKGEERWKEDRRAHRQ